MVSGEPFVTGGCAWPRRRSRPGTISASVTADTTAKTSSCQPKLTVNRLTTMAAAAPTANQTETRAVVAASTEIKATMAASQSIVSNHMENAPFCRIIL